MLWALMKTTTGFSIVIGYNQPDLSTSRIVPFRKDVLRLVRTATTSGQ